MATAAGAPEARAIVQLDDLTINRIAAGEIIHRPASAIKELLENCIDAGARAVTITLGAGGLKRIEIADDGHGIRREDLPLVCERFATSKLRAYADLQAIGTFGFRGEALASISHVSRVTVTTATVGAQCAYRATYADGKLVPEPGAPSAAPRACARTVGTTICAEDLFHNAPARRRAMRSPSDEYARVLDVVGKYALAFPHVALCVRKTAGGSGASAGGHADLTTRGTGDTAAAVRAVHGGALARELLNAECADTGRGLVAKLCCSSANWAAKRASIAIFINGRLVECSSLRAAVEHEYAHTLPKGSHPFALLQLTVPPARLDVNVHPTKADVLLADEAEAVALVQAAARLALEGSNASRTFAVIAGNLPALGASPALAQSLLGPMGGTQLGLRAAGSSGEALGKAGEAGGPRKRRAAALGAEGEGAEEGEEAEEEPRSAAPVATRPVLGLLPPGGAQPSDEDEDGAGGSPLPTNEVEGDSDGDGDGESADEGAGGGGGGRARRGATAAAGSGDGVKSHKRTRTLADAADAAAAAPSGAFAARGGKGLEGEGKEGKGGSNGVYPQYAVRVNRGSQRGALDAYVTREPRPHERRGGAHPGGDAAGEALNEDEDEAEAVVARVLADGDDAAAGGVRCLTSGAPAEPRAADVCAAGSVRSGALGASLEADALPSECALTSVRHLRAAARADAHADVARALSRCVWVGLVHGSALLVQHETRLLLLELRALSAELFRQLALHKWGDAPRINFATPAPVAELAKIALRASAAAGGRGGSGGGGGGAGEDVEAEAEACIEVQAEAVRALFESKAEMLDEYLSLRVADGCLCSLPQLAAGYVPPLCQLPEFVLEIATAVDWSDEKVCFDGLASALGKLFAVRAPSTPAAAADGAEGRAAAAEGEGAPADAAADASGQAKDAKAGAGEGPASAPAAFESLEGHEWTVRHVLLPRLQKAACFAPPRRHAYDGTVTQVACTQTLYRIFERC
ncbi:hypothetical protein T492DRAFT_914985 [Pavlovales sp. CCMP2436]|nr:hypothetical protein T492DRAFT_914985 [Pavlovales sp. CCMP2436]